METIFDHDPTQEELDILLGDGMGISVEDARTIVAGWDEGWNLGYVAVLMEVRGDRAAALRYLERIRGTEAWACLAGVICERSGRIRSSVRPGYQA